MVYSVIVWHGLRFVVMVYYYMVCGSCDMVRHGVVGSSVVRRVWWAVVSEQNSPSQAVQLFL